MIKLQNSYSYIETILTCEECGYEWDGNPNDYQKYNGEQVCPKCGHKDLPYWDDSDDLFD